MTKKINGAKLNRAKFEIEFDNGGGALLVTRSYVHHYDDGKQLADDVWQFMQDSDTSSWGGNQKPDGLGLTGHRSSVAIDRADVQGFDFSSLDDVSGNTQREFLKRMAEHMGAKWQ